MGEREGSKKKKEKEIRNGSRVLPRQKQPNSDPRFAHMHWDPRFQAMPKNNTKVSIDSRFSGMFTDKAFIDSFGDKRGAKPFKSRKLVNPLRRYYKLDEEDDEGEGFDGNAEVEKSVASEEDQVAIAAHLDGLVARKQRGKPDGIGRIPKNRVIARVSEGVRSEDQEQEEADENLDVVVQQKARARNLRPVEKRESDEESEDGEGCGLEEGAEEEDTSSSSSDSDSDVEEVSLEEEEKVPTTNDETRRLAMMNLDWEHIRAVDLLVLIRSYVPKGGSVYSVRVYPSEFGIEQMKEENLHGPKSVFSNDDSYDEDDDPEKLREYEKAKLRYYYAVVDCDSPSTAAHLYTNCDGLELERTSNTLDFRYIPDEMEFKRPPRDVATDGTADYKPIEFATRALQHSNVKLTWDEDEPVRARALRRKFNDVELNEMDYRAYVASSSDSESDGDVDGDKKGTIRSKYLSLLAGAEEGDKVSGKNAERGNIEIKFHTGLDELSEKLLSKAKKDRADETVWEAYTRRKKEKKNARKHKKGDDLSSEDEEIHRGGGTDANHKDDLFSSHGTEDPFDDPFFNQEGGGDGASKSTKGKDSKSGKEKVLKGSKDDERKKKKEEVAREKKEAARNQAELELLLLDNHMVQNGEGRGQIPSTGNTRKQKKKGTKGTIEQQKEKIASSAKYDDPRFAARFTSPDFALDPTDPYFKRNGSHMAEMKRERFQSFHKAREDLQSIIQQDGDDGSNRKRKAELNSLVHSLKSKVQTKRGRALGIEHRRL